TAGPAAMEPVAVRSPAAGAAPGAAVVRAARGLATVVRGPVVVRGVSDVRRRRRMVGGGAAARGGLVVRAGGAALVVGARLGVVLGICARGAVRVVVVGLAVFVGVVDGDAPGAAVPPVAGVGRRGAGREPHAEAHETVSRWGCGGVGVVVRRRRGEDRN